MITHIGSKIHVGITNRVRLQFKLLVNLVEHGHIIVVNNGDVVNIAQYVGLVDIAASVNFGLDTPVQVIWARFVTHMYHTVIQVLA